jgi:hypothetical protein
VRKATASNEIALSPAIVSLAIGIGARRLEVQIAVLA